MLPAFVIGLREGLEAVVIVGAIAVYLRVRGRADLLRRVWRASAVAVAVCLVVALLLRFVEINLPWRQQEQFETVVGLSAVAMVTYMVVWMRRFPKDLQRESSAAAASALGRDSGRALVALAFFAVLREGFEIAVFAMATIGLTGANAWLATGGACLGVLVAVLVGVGVMRGSRHLNIARFFRATAFILVLTAAGIAMTTVHEANAAGWITFGQTPQFDLAWLAPPGSVLSSITTGMFGIQPYPVVIEVVAWFAYFVPMAAVVLWPRRQRAIAPAAPEIPHARRRRYVFAGALGAAAVGLGLGLGLGLSGGASHAPAGGTASRSTPLFASLDDVSCPSPRHCVAVGDYLPDDRDAAQGDPDGDGRATHTLVEVSGDAGWRLLTSPDEGHGGAALSGVSCPSPKRCVAVGYYKAGRYGLTTIAAPPNRPLIESFDGRAWQIVDSPSVAPNSVLESVSCPSTSLCYAVGYSAALVGGTPVESPFIERFDGSAWRLVPVPSPADTSSDLTAIACPSPSSCVAVGNFASRSHPSATRPLIEELEGGRWSPSVLPADSAGAGILYDVDCLAVGRCVAVGSTESSRPSGAALVLTSRGATWTTSVAALRQRGDISLTTVACRSESDCVVSGTDWVSRTAGTEKVLARVDPDGWHDLGVADELASVDGIACPAGRSCLLVGSISRNTFGNTTALIASLSGHAWRAEPSPAP